MRRLRTLMAGAAAGSLLVAGSAMPAMAEEVDSDDPNTLVIATSQSMEEWNPLLQTYVIEHQFRQLQYLPLIVADAETYAPTPGLAQDWEVSEDGLTWTYYLQEGLNWQDGEPFTAEDVEYTFHIIREDPQISARNAAKNANIDSVEVIDEYTVEVTLTEPNIMWETDDTVVLPKHIWEEHEGAWGDFANDDFPIVGIGPYQVTDFETDTFIRYERYEDFYRGPAGFDEIVFQYYTEPDTSVAALETGEVDLIGGLNENQLNRLTDQPNIETNSAPDRRWFAIRFNTGAETRDGEAFGDAHPALQDQAVRNAIHHALDRDELIERVRGGHGLPATSIVPSAFSDIWWEPSDDVRVDFNLEEAGELLDEAGYELGANGVRVGPDGEPLHLRLGVDAGNVERESTAQFIDEWLTEIGISVEQIISEDVQDRFDEGTIDMAFTGWGINANPQYNLYRQSCDQRPAEPGGGGTDAFYCNPEFDTLIDASQVETDEAARTEMYYELQETLYTDAPIIFLWYPNVMEAYRTDKIAGFTTQPAGEGMIMGQIGAWAYHEAQPAEGESATGTSTGVIIGVIVVVALGVAALIFFLVRRKKTADDRE